MVVHCHVQLEFEDVSFSILYGCSPPYFLGSVGIHTPLQAVEEFMLERLLMSHEIWQLISAQHRAKQYADMRHSEYAFQIHDMVLLKLQLYRQGLVYQTRYSKLSPRFYKPFESYIK